MILLFAFGLLALNALISIWNAIAVGRSWEESKANGGWPRFMIWMAAIMSASGFTWCYLALACFGLLSAGKLTVEDATAAFNLGYLVIIPGVIFSGIMIMVDSWGRAYRNRSVGNTVLAGYNTFANVHNIYRASSGAPNAIKELANYFGKAKSADARKAAVVILVVVCVGCGVFTTWAIARKAAANVRPAYRYGGRSDFGYRPQ